MRHTGPGIAGRCSKWRAVMVHTVRTASLLCAVGLCALNAAFSMKICAFNIQSFGESKASNKKVMGILLKEVRDSKGRAIQALVKDLNRFDKSNTYSYIESERLGRKTYKEQYVYVYRNNVLKVKEQYQYPKPEVQGTNDTDVFSREPFIVRFHSPTTLMKDLILIGQHTSPKSAMKEMDELYIVFREICRKWKTEVLFWKIPNPTRYTTSCLVSLRHTLDEETGTCVVCNQNVMILGDLNAACGYVTVKGWRAVRLRSDRKFRWLIGDEQDTTVREKTRCAYDRIIVHGREIIATVVPGSAQPFNFKETFHLTEDEALAVSDHFPVEVDLKPNHRYLLRSEL
ncbi:deoxyribonuclease I-like 1-like isoform X2 [Phycodurus eques]|uniref:deoxyribonuclease I-like 1-like isoform X2 n=1 Tax=Phycodurus eques TaxID=693459 RepID=UPI002ACD6B66|nr:deoxyribonuclease I-like 1-like isoform X2 [Phycodurus eques]